MRRLSHFGAADLDDHITLRSGRHATQEDPPSDWRSNSVSRIASSLERIEVRAIHGLPASNGFHRRRRNPLEPITRVIASE